MRTTLYLPEEIYEKLRKVAFDKRVSMNSLIVEALAERFKFDTPFIRKDILKDVKLPKIKEAHRPYDICPKHKIYYSSCGD